jgi:hypothetical protein
MIMKKIISLLIAMIFSACSPQVTEPPTATSTPLPTQTPIPTPTLHPEFIELQNTINAENGFVLTNDGVIEHNGDPVPNVTVTADGRYVLVVGDEMVMLDPNDVTFGEDGIKIDGYELNENGEWVEAVSEAVLQAQAEFEKYGYDYSDLTLSKSTDGKVIATDEEGEVVYEDGKFDLDYAVEQAGQLDLMPTDIEPDKTILEGSGQYVINESTRGRAFTEYFKPLFDRVREEFVKMYGFDPANGGTPSSERVMLDPEINAWGSDMTVDFYDLESDHYLYYELADTTIHIVPLQ